MKALICTFLLNILQPSNPPQSVTLLYDFMHDVASHQMSNTALEKKYFCPSILKQTPAGDTLRSMADYYFSSLRMQLDEHQIKVDDLTFIPFDSLPNKEYEIPGDTRQIYVAQYHNETLYYFLIDGNKISSFVLFKTGLRAFFFTFCD